MEEMTVEGYLLWIVELLEKNNSLLETMLQIITMEHKTIDMLDGKELPPNVTNTFECAV